MAQSKNQVSVMKLARVFPRKTKASPDDEMAFFGPPPFTVEADEVHVDVTFTADMSFAEELAKQWQHIGPVKMGGVAFGDSGAEFIPGRYVKHGYTFTSRGCPRRCWFCSVWKRQPWVGTKEQPHPDLLPIQDGWNILDDNLLSCPEHHVRAVFDMLRRQNRRAEFTGGLEAMALQDYQVDLLAGLKPRPKCYFAYDPGDPLETLQSAAKRMLEAGFTQASHRLLVYVLIGYPKDTLELAENRLRQMLSIGFTPYAMLWQPETPSAEKWRPNVEWNRFQRAWLRPAIIHATRDKPTRQFSFPNRNLVQIQIGD